MLGCCSNNEAESCECKDCTTSEKEVKRQQRPKEQKILKQKTDWSGQDLKRFTRKSPKPKSSFAPRSGALPEQESAPTLIFEPKRQFVEQQLKRFSSRIHKEVEQDIVEPEEAEPVTAPATNHVDVVPAPQLEPESVSSKKAGGSVMAVMGLLILGGILLSSGSKSK